MTKSTPPAVHISQESHRTVVEVAAHFSPEMTNRLTQFLACLACADQAMGQQRAAEPAENAQLIAADMKLAALMAQCQIFAQQITAQATGEGDPSDLGFPEFGAVSPWGDDLA